MSWKDSLKKEIISHHALTTSVEPKGVVDLTQLDDLGTRMFQGYVNKIKSIPDSYTGFIRPYYLEILKPEMENLKSKYPKAPFKLLLGTALKNVNHPTGYLKYVVEKEKQLLNPLPKGD